MFDARRPTGRLFYLLLAVGMMLTVSRAQGPATTTINDIVYRADATPAGGVLLISWPAFTTSGGQTVAGGTKSVTLGTGGTFTVSLVPNVGATPAGTVYTVVYQLNDGTEKTEYWMVATSSPTTIAAVRTILGTTGSATQIASQQFVNAAVATKANDAAVVHLSGSETISESKQFATAPSVPTPVLSTDAVNKAYVDGAVTTGGGGAFVSKAGDAMSGPLTLPGDPVTSLQASTKHYVDVATTTKADLSAGLVPATELGAGSPNSSNCLNGNQTWGPCGSSSNAVAIQSIPVDTTTPADNQVITYVASAGKYEPRAGGGVTGGMQAVKYAADFGWSQTPATDLSTAGAKTVNLSACPLGVTGTEQQYYVYLSGTGTAEAVLVTGGTCAGNGLPGTLQFTTVNAHSAGYVLGSASSGLQEALIGARFVPDASGMQGGKVVLPPNAQIDVHARVSVRSSNMTVDFSGSIVNCLVNDTCIFIGDTTNITLFSDITLIGPHGRPGVPLGQHPFIEVNAQKTRLYNVVTQYPYASPTSTFSSYVQVDSDQAFLLDGLDTAWGANSGNAGVLCNATTCNPVIYAPGPTGTNSAVGYLKHMNLTLGCAANGVDWQSGNSVRISDSVIQGFAQYGVRGGTARGGFQGMKLENVYEEIGICTNPAGNIGAAGIIAQGETVEISGPAGVGIQGTAGGPQGKIPQFANTGTTEYRYYIVAHHATFGTSNALFAGGALTNGIGNITVTTPDISGATSFDLLRVTNLALPQVQFSAPYGAGNYAVATGVARTSVCSNGVCTFVDSQAALGSYTVVTPTYFPLLSFWPGNLILGSNHDSNSVLSAAMAFVPSMPLDTVDVQGTVSNAVVAQYCAAVNNWTPLLASCYASYDPSDVYAVSALMLTTKPAADAGLATNIKGRLNFGTVGSGPSHIITLADSNFQKTVATGNNRPKNDPTDAYIGYDRGDSSATYGISFGAPVSLSNYIGNAGDGTNWLERLTTGLKEFKTSVQMDSGLTVAGQVQASSFLWTGSGPWSVQAGFAALSAAPSGKSAIGFGSGGKLQVSENGGSVVEVAKLDTSGNVSENANTATALAATPTQCNGSFATGIQVNGNANCGTADVMQLAERTVPAGLSNFGLFWFDSTCHCPKVIDNNGQAVQLGLTNVFNSDANGTNVANVLEERNLGTPQEFRIYGTYTDNANYERMRLAFDSADNYFYVGADALGTGVQRGVGIWLQGQLRWVVDATFNLRPWTDNNRDLGSSAQRVANGYFGTSVSSPAFWLSVPNAGTTGTTINDLVKLTGDPATAVITATTDTSGAVGVAMGGAGTTGNALIATSGTARCAFDNATTAGDFVQISSSVAGGCHDAGASYPASGQVIGQVMSTHGSAGAYTVELFGTNTMAGAPTVSPAFTGTPTAPTPATADNSTKIATTAYVQAQGFVASDSTPWFTQPTATGTVSFLTTTNTAKLFGVVYPASTAVATTKVTYNVVTADAGSNTYDIGIVNSSGAVVAHIGPTSAATFAGSTGWKTLNWTGAATIARGKYYLAITTNCTTSCAQIIGSSTSVGLTFAGGVSESVSSGGTLSGTITIPTDTYTATTMPTWAVQ